MIIMMDKIKADRIIRSNRKTISLEIMPGGELVVRMPHYLKLQILNQFLAKKSGWIKNKQSLARKKALREPHFKDGEEFLFLGKYFPLKMNNSKKFSFNAAFHIPKKDNYRARELMVSWYRKQASGYISERTGEIAASLKISYAKISINSAKKRWGSCSAKGNLNFPYRLVMAPPRVIDYVIVHELIHILERNHSRHYWQKVEKAMPDYRKCRDWLKNNGHLLVI